MHYHDMGFETKIRFDLKGLEQLNDNFKDSEKFVTKVGILGDKALRKNSQGITNAEIGAAHEFGSFIRKLPRRSFLKDSLLYKKDELVTFLGKLIKNNILSRLGIKSIFSQMGIRAEKIIQEGFESKGFSKWTPLKDSTIKAKKSSSILIDTAQLRSSITSVVDMYK